MKRDDVYFEAMAARDHRFDGKFFVGVKTTGIYCRPICPAKPKRENVEFFQSYIAAENAGYRPCLRCRPESAPLSPVWIGKSAIVRRAIKIINTQDTIEFDEDHFADLFGVSARHLRRVFSEEIGKTPKQLSFENRLNLARKLINETNLAITEIAFAAGFNSIRRFNAAFKDRFSKSPSEIRRNKIKGASPLQISLSYRPPFNFEALLHTYRMHQVGNLERFENNKMYRIIAFDGKVGEIAIANDSDGSRLMVEIDFPDTSVIHSIISRVRGLFDLDSDPVVVSNSLEANSKIGAILKKNAGIRIPSGWDPFEIAVGTILGQLVSVEHARKLTQDLIDQLGTESGKTFNGKTIKLFPTPKQIAASDLKNIKTTTMRRQTLITFASLVDRKKISLEPTQDVEEFISQVTAIKGIGAWSASYMALKALRHTDAFPASDLILARALEGHSVKAIEEMRPWRGYVAALFWREYSGKLKKGVSNEY